jgi:hypothetical protein
MDRITQLLKQIHEMAEYSGDSPKPLGDFLYEGMLTPGYEAEFLKDPAIKTEDITDADKIKRFDPYQNFAKPEVRGISDPELAVELYRRNLLTRKPPNTMDNEMAGRPTYENVFADQGPQIQMNVGGRVAQAGSTLTADEYQENLIDYYDFGGIKVTSAPAADPAAPTTPDPGPQIVPASYADSPDEDSIFNMPLPTYGSAYKKDASNYYSAQDYDSYIKEYDLSIKKDKSGDGQFENFVVNNKKEISEGAAISTALPPTMSGAVALGYAFNHIARKVHRANAAKIKATGGKSGSMFKFNGQVLSRAPGSRIFTGNMGGMDQRTAIRSDEIRKGFIPGTMTFQDDEDGPGFNSVVATDGQAMDPFGVNHSAQVASTGHMMTSASGAQVLREMEFRKTAGELGIDISSMTKKQFQDAALAHKMHVDGVMKGSSFYDGVFHTTSKMSPENYNAAKNLRFQTSSKYILDSIVPDYGLSTPTTPVTPVPSTEPKVPSSSPPPSTTTPPPSSDDGDSDPPPPSYSPVDRPAYYDDSDDGYQSDPGGGSAGSSSQDFSAQAAAEAPYADEFNYRQGGRVGMQMGGTAPQAAPAGFVERPPSQVSEAATVADDKPMSVPEGTFVINAAAVEIAGEADIAKMLNKAYENYRARGGKEVMGRTPSKEEVDVAVSRGEVLVPPAIAKIIGYDRLEKINNRGKKETKQRIKENGQRPVKAAKGGFINR